MSVHDLEARRRLRAIEHFHRWGFSWVAPPPGFQWGGHSVRCGCAGWQSRGYKRQATALRKFYAHLLEAAGR